MDHFFQIRGVGPAEHDMLEAYTTLGFLAAHTERAKLLTVITGVHYRHPGLLAKAMTTLDVLSGGRGMIGLGAGWNEEESRGLGFPFPPVAERFERLEETLQYLLQMWSDNDGPFKGQHYQAERLMNVPQALSKPHPPIMVGGGGEKTTKLIDELGRLHALGFSAAIGMVPQVPRLDVLERIGSDVIPVASAF